MSSLVDYLKSQESLEKQAKEHMPYDPHECTYIKGPIRQELYACLTCYRTTSQLNAICYACSIRCHTSHDLVELFTKRNRTCDCGTSRVNGPCLVRYPQWSKLDSQFQKENENHKYTPDIPDSSNSYGHNFHGKFCDCDKIYNPLTDSNMIQCTFGIACDEDWYHEECIMGLQPGVINRNPKGIQNSNNRLNELSEPGIDAQDDDNNDNDSDSENEYDILPLPGFPSLESFDTIICWKCVARFPTELKELSTLLDCENIPHVPASTIDERITKMMSSSSEISAKRKKKEFPYTIFLREDYKECLKSYLEKEETTKLAELLKKYSFLFQDDPIYRPPDDDDDSSSVFELGIRELNNIPSDQAVQGLVAYEKIKSKLTEFLKPFAQEGRIVTKEEVKEFFNSDMKKNS